MPLTLDPANAIAPMSLDSPSDNAMTALYRVALGPVNAEHYLPIFARFDDAGRTTTTWNWPAALFTLSWLVFRQLWGAALVYVAAAEGLALLVFGVGRQFLHLPQQVEWGILAAIVLFSCVLPGLFANAVLHTEIRKRIARALSASRTVPEAAAMLERQASSRQRLSTVVIGHVVVVATAGLAYLLFPPGSGTPDAGDTAAATSAQPPSTAPASQPTSGLAAVSVLRGAAPAPASSLASGTVAPAPEAALPASGTQAVPPATSAPAAPTTPLPVAPPVPAAPPTARSPASSPAAQAAAKPVAPAPAPTPPEKVASKSTPPAPSTPAATASTPAPAAKVRASAPANPPTSPPAKAAPPPATVAKAPAASKPARPAPAQPAASTASDPELAMVGSAPGFYINVGLFAEEANARKTQSRLLNEGLPAFRQPLQGAKGQRIRVRVGPFSTKAEADTAARSIQGMGLEAVVFKK